MTSTYDFLRQEALSHLNSVNGIIGLLQDKYNSTGDEAARQVLESLGVALHSYAFIGRPASANNLDDEQRKAHLTGSPTSTDDNPASKLQTPRAMELWECAQEQGWVDDQLQPVGLSRPDAALLAARMAKLLGIEGWTPFEHLWHRKNMRQDYNKTQYNRKTDEFEQKLKRKLK